MQSTDDGKSRTGPLGKAEVCTGRGYSPVGAGQHLCASLRVNGADFAEVCTGRQTDQAPRGGFTDGRPELHGYCH